MEGYDQDYLLRHEIDGYDQSYGDMKQQVMIRTIMVTLDKKLHDQDYVDMIQKVMISTSSRYQTANIFIF